MCTPGKRVCRKAPGVRIPPHPSCFALALRRIRYSFPRSRNALRSFERRRALSLYYVYLIESLSAPGQRYVGMTDDLRQRLREHNAGESSYTAQFRPWKLTTYVAFTDPAKVEAFPRHEFRGIAAILGGWRRAERSLPSCNV